MRTVVAPAVASLVLVPAVVAACVGPVSPPSAPPTGAAVVTPAGQTRPAPTATTTPPSPTPFAYPRNPAPFVDGEAYAVTIRPEFFVVGIDHPFLPFNDGATFVFDGDEHVEVAVLAETRRVLGVLVTVVRDQVFQDGELVEDTLDWYAQDRQGNVWYFGEQTAEYENGSVTSTAGSWEAGVDGAQPGIVMLAVPEAGDTYRQEFYAGEAEDVAAVIATVGEISVGGCTWTGSDVLVTEEWTPLEPDVRERKTYVRGYGVVEVRTIQGGNEVTTISGVPCPS